MARGHFGAEKVEGHGRERNVSAERCMYRRRYMYVCARHSVYVPVHVVRCTLTYMCIYVCERGVRRRWAILISLRGLSSTSAFPHRSRLCGTFAANQPTRRHPPPTHPRERTLRVVTFGGHFKPSTPLISALPLLVHRSFHICSEPRSL